MEATTPPPAALDSLSSTRKDLSLTEKKEIYAKLLEVSEKGILPHGAKRKIAEIVGRSQTAIGKLWKSARAQTSAGINISPALKNKRAQRQYSTKYSKEDIIERVRKLPFSKRTTIRDVAKNISIPRSTLHRMIKKDTTIIRPHSSALKPTLTDENKRARVQFALGKIGNNGLYNDLFDEVHVDEKWLYMTRDHQTFWVAEGEEPPVRKTRHKQHIEKIMFLAAVARPRYDFRKKEMFDGKIGLWPVGNYVPAKRNSCRRPAGTLVWQNTSLNRDCYRELLLEKVLPAIKDKFPAADQRKGIKLQQDNAPAHVLPNDQVVAAKIGELGLNLTISNQPSNSPDTNINDLAFFRSLQTIQLKDPSTNSDELIQAVVDAFDNYESYLINNAFLTLQCCFNSIIETDGDNTYNITHMSKEKLIRSGQLPVSIFATDKAVTLNQHQFTG